MNFLEFVSDHYAALNIEHCFNGFLFNKIPLVKQRIDLVRRFTWLQNPMVSPLGVRTLIKFDF